MLIILGWIKGNTPNQIKTMNRCCPELNTTRVKAYNAFFFFLLKYILHVTRPARHSPLPQIIYAGWLGRGINFPCLFQSETAPISGSFIAIPPFWCCSSRAWCWGRGPCRCRGAATFPIGARLSVAVLQQARVHYIGTTFLCKKQVRLNLNCVK